MLMSRMDSIYMQCTITKKQRSFWEKRIDPARNFFSRQGGNDMFRRLTQIICLSVAVMFLSGCLAYTPVLGVLWTSAQGPITATTYDQSARMGRSCASSIMALFSWGDASIDAAKNAGQLKQVASVDFDTLNVLGMYGRVCTVVRGN
jgi:hypothetical protein